MKMLVFETFYCKKEYEDGSTIRIKLSFCGDEDLYFTSIYERVTDKNGEILARSIRTVTDSSRAVTDSSTSSDYAKSHDLFEREKKYYLRIGFTQCESLVGAK